MTAHAFYASMRITVYGFGGRRKKRKASVDSAEGLEVGCKAFGVQGNLHMARKTKGQLCGLTFHQ